MTPQDPAPVVTSASTQSEGCSSGNAEPTGAGSLHHNPEPLKVVKVRRGEALAKPGFRCDHEDGRGRCTSRDTKNIWLPDERRTITLCPRHLEDAT